MGRTSTSGWLLAVSGIVIVALWVANRLTHGGIPLRAHKAGYFSIELGSVMILWGAGAIVARRSGQYRIEQAAWAIGAVVLIALLFRQAFSAFG